MSMQFEWKEEYSVGNSKLDQQHQYLFRMSNEIQNADFSEAKDYIKKLYKYTREHFSFEEEHMQGIGFPELEGHKELHNKMITDLNSITEAFSDNINSFEEIKIFLYSWWVDHILHQDKKYFNFTRTVK